MKNMETLSIILFVTIMAIVFAVPYILIYWYMKHPKKERTADICVECKLWEHDSGHYGKCRLNGRDLTTRDNMKCLFKEKLQS
jgi:hypothetical protein